MSAANVINRLIGTAKDLGAQGRDDRYGYGEVDPVAALREPVAEVAANPLTVAASKTESGKPEKPSPAAQQPQDEGGAAPQPVSEAAGLSGARQSPVAKPVGSSLTVGLAAALLILIAGAAGVLARHRTRRHDRN